MWEGIRNQKHGAYFPTVLRGHSGLPKPGLRLNTLLVEAASGQQRASRVYSRGCQRLATTASHLRTVSFQHPSRYTLPLLPSLLPFPRCIFFFFLATIWLSMAQKKVSLTRSWSWGLRVRSGDVPRKKLTAVTQPSPCHQAAAKINECIKRSTQGAKKGDNDLCLPKGKII